MNTKTIYTDHMPELPEVETIRSDLNQCLRHKTIVDVAVVKRRLVRHSIQHFITMLVGKKIVKVDRVAKLLILKLSNETFLLIHLKMTGQLIYKEGKQVVAGGHSFASDTKGYPNQYTYITITFFDGSRLYFNDMRQFGYMKIVDADRLEKIVAGYGIEPLTVLFTWSAFKLAFAKRSTTIKAALLNQTIIAGIGNIYADEICFYAKVLPYRKINTLSEPELRKIYTGCNHVLQKAIQLRGTTFNSYTDSKGRTGNFSSKLRVYRQTGERCIRCKQGIIQRIVIAGRGTHFCEKCQK